MSITISHLLKLPSLREAKVIAGSSGLSKIVSSISVLEYADPTTLTDELFTAMEFLGSEIVISGLINIHDNIPAQCSTIRRLHDVGEVGLILFYVGIFIPFVDKKLIELANQLGFPLILMPEERMNLRYSDVIVEVMEAIFNDHRAETYFAGEILERISLLPNHQRSMDTVLRMLSDRIHCSLFLTDHAFHILNLGTWPRNSNLDITPIFNYYENKPLSGIGHPIKFGDPHKPLWINTLNISNENTADMSLFFVKENMALTSDVCKQCHEVIQLFVNIWSQQHGTIGASELIRAILNDEPIKMFRLADILNIDVKSIHTMWILKNKNPIKASEALETFNRKVLGYTKTFLNENCTTILADVYEKNVVAFMNTTYFREPHYPLGEELLTTLENEGFPCILCQCPRLLTTSEVRNAYILIDEYLETTRRIYPYKELLTLQEVEFSKICQEIIASGESAINEKLGALKSLETSDPQQDHDWIETLSVFLLDAQESMVLTAQKTFLHKNTVKYRIQRMNARLSYSVTKMPEAYNLYLALAIQRLIDHY